MDVPGLPSSCDVQARDRRYIIIYLNQRGHLEGDSNGI